MCYARRKIEGGVGALRWSDDTNFLKFNGQSRNLNVYVFNAPTVLKTMSMRPYFGRAAHDVSLVVKSHF